MHSKGYMNSVLYSKPKPQFRKPLHRRALAFLSRTGRKIYGMLRWPLARLSQRRHALTGNGVSPFYEPEPVLCLGDGTAVPIAPEGPHSSRWVFGTACTLMACAAFLALLIGATQESAPVPAATTDVLLYDQGVTTRLSTKARTVSGLLSEMGVSLSAGDKVYPAPEEELEEGDTIQILRAFTVYVTAGGQFTELSLSQGCVRDALEAAGVAYDDQDEVSPAPYVPLEAGMRIEVTDVEVKYESVAKPIAFKKVTRNDDTLQTGKTRIEQEGSEGIKNVKYRVVYRDGVESEREVIEQTISRHPVDQITIVGTKKDVAVSVKDPVKLQNDNRKNQSPPKESEIKETLYIEVTAYTHTGNKTATGTRPKVGTIAVNPKQIPYGTRLYVEGYGYGVAEDTGAFRHTDRFQIDLFMDTVKECLRWGRKRNVKVFVLK